MEEERREDGGDRQPEDRARDAGADAAIVCGSGPTVIGIFRGPTGADRARDAAARVASVHAVAVAAPPIVRTHV